MKFAALHGGASPGGAGQGVRGQREASPGGAGHGVPGGASPGGAGHGVRGQREASPRGAGHGVPGGASPGELAMASPEEPALEELAIYIGNAQVR
jgi:hypothetical protein